MKTRISPDKTKHLLSAAQSYLSLGYSVIPAYGNARPDAPKAAAVRWLPYQTRRPTANIVQNWFTFTPFTALAIITGRVSNLAILDFDDSDVFDDFCMEYPDFVKTRTVKTRRGHHLYFHVAHGLQAKTQKRRGVDWLYDGCYAIAPPSQFDEAAYKLQRGGMPLTLAQPDINAIQAFVNRHRAVIPTIEEASTPATAPTKPKVRVRLGAADIKGLYRQRAREGNRNNALFRTSLAARDHGWSLEQTTALLVDLHIEQRTANESTQSRQREALATIKSAFSRPPRSVDRDEPDQLPNTVREHLFQKKRTAAVRVLEGLRLAGINVGQTFTEKQAKKLLKGQIGHYSIRKALSAEIFKRVSPSGHPPTPDGVAHEKHETSISKCLEITQSKPKLNRRGRPTIVYQMPSNIELADQLGVKLTRISDPLTPDDLKSASATRRAAHREFVKRRPGQYSSGWLAKRIGISRSTKQRYDNQLDDLHFRPMYTEIPLFTFNLHEIPPEDMSNGCFLRDSDGHVYPPFRAIARRLIKQKKRFSLMRRTVNYYWYGEEPLFLVGGLTAAQMRSETRRRQTEARIEQHIQQKQAKPACTLPPVEPSSPAPSVPVMPRRKKAAPPKVQKSAVKLKPKPKQRNYKRKFRESSLENHAKRIQAGINALSEAASAQMSIQTARRLVDQYGLRQTEYSLWRVRRRQNVQNPTGLYITILRSSAKHSALR